MKGGEVSVHYFHCSLFFSVYQVGKISFYTLSNSRVCVYVSSVLVWATTGVCRCRSTTNKLIILYGYNIMIILCLDDCCSSRQSDKIRDQFSSETIRRLDGRTDIVFMALFCSRPLQQDETAELQLCAIILRSHNIRWYNNNNNKQFVKDSSTNVFSSTLVLLTSKVYFSRLFSHHNPHYHSFPRHSNTTFFNSTNNQSFSIV